MGLGKLFFILFDTLYTMASIVFGLDLDYSSNN